MSEQPTVSSFHSPIGPLIEVFLGDKRSRGFRYVREEGHLRQLDRYLVASGLTRTSLPRELVERWLSKSTHRRPSTHQHRLIIVRQLADFLQLHGYSAYSPPLMVARRHDRSTARIFTREEVRRIYGAVDHLAPDPRSPLRHLVMPELFRMLYGCGLRIGEALRLTVADVELNTGVLRVLQGKFRRDRFLPVAPALQGRLKRYAEALGPRVSTEPFFPSPKGGSYSNQAIYQVFRQLLEIAGIAHGGRGRGPRLHEIRHTFAVHRLEQWYREGADLNARLPLLATYMGHRCMVGTQWYLQLTEALFTDLSIRLDGAYGHVIPEEVNS